MSKVDRRVKLLKRRSTKLTQPAERRVRLIRRPRPSRWQSRPRVPMRAALSDPQLLGKVLAGDSWKPWRALLIAAMGERLTRSERKVFEQLTGREHEPNRRVEELIGCIGRRGGKSRAIATLAAYVAGLCEHPALVPGEQGIALIIAPDQKQAGICLDYVEAAFRGSPVLSQLIIARTQRELRLSNGVSVEVRASDHRTVRGPTYILVIGDEAAFWLTGDKSSNPDHEIINAVRPGLATTRGMLAIISSPYARRGVLWEAYDKDYGPKGDPLILVSQAASRTMNETLPQSVVDRAMERDPASASAEYLAKFRSDVETFVSVEAVRACVTKKILERRPVEGIAYVGFVDPSGGSQDSFSLAIGHVDHNRETVVIDALREVRPPFSPEAVAIQYCRLLKSYKISKVIGDRYGGEWPREQFSKYGILYEPAAKPKSDLYQDLLSAINSKRVSLLDLPRTIAQITSLERRTGRSGRDIIDHPPGGRDDLANAVAGVVSNCLIAGVYNIAALAGTNDKTDPLGIDAYRRARLGAYLLSGGMMRL